MKSKQRKKIIKSFAVFACAFSIMGNSVFAAQKFSDVPTTHWAYDAIVRVAEKGIMVGGTTGEYKPNNPLDKFVTARILAVSAGYKYTGLTGEEEKSYNSAYDKNKSIFEIYKKAFTKWNSATDKEIAYLMEKGIITEQDLGQFVVKDDSGKESLRALSRQEAAVFISRLMGKTGEASMFTPSNLFADDSKINPSAKPYVYYLRSIGILSGDTNNMFTPNGAVTRATMAIMLDKALNLSGGAGSSQSAGTNTAINQQLPSSAGTVQAETIIGTIEKIHIGIHALQLKYTSGEVKLIKLDNTANILIDGQRGTINDLKENMTFTGIVKNGIVTEISAQSVKTPVQNETIPVSPGTSAVQQTIVGIVKEVNNSSTPKTIAIEIKLINPGGGIITQKENYTLDNGAAVTKGGKAYDFSSVSVNDIITAKVYGNKIASMDIEEKNREFTGVVLDKKTDDTLGKQYYEIEDNNGNIHELIADSSSYLSRKGTGKVKFKEVRIGDSVEITAEYSTIKELYAYGSKSTKEGTVKEIHMLQNDLSYIVLQDSNGKTQKYNIISGDFERYNIRINDAVELYLDSKEIEDIAVSNAKSTGYYVGYIEEVGNKYVYVKPVLSSTNTIRASIDGNTLIIDGSNGSSVKTSKLYRNMKVYIKYVNTKSDLAKSIIILEN